jgi:mRNA interferase RelE/StbE
MYRLELTSQAQRQLDKLSVADLERIAAAIQEFRDNPRASEVKKLRGPIYRIRVGDWRIVYAVFDKDNLIVVGKITRRSEDTYKKIKDLFQEV